MLTVPDPVPDAPEPIDTHDVLACAVHVQPASVVTLILTLPPAAVNVCWEGDRSNPHVAAFCSICVRMPLTSTPPCLVLAFGLAATFIVSCPPPCPDAGDSPVIQFASEDALQVHSGWVSTATVAVPPAESTDDAGAVSVTPHLAGDGPVDVTTVEPHPIDAQATHQPTRDKSAFCRRRRSICSISSVVLRIVRRRRMKPARRANKRCRG
jgi:hypothetical protein